MIPNWGTKTVFLNMINLAVSGTKIKCPTWAICMWLIGNSQGSQGGKEELLEETKGTVYAFPTDLLKTARKERYKKQKENTENNNRGMCLEKRHMKARHEKTETAKIGERRKKSTDWTCSTGVSWHEIRMPLVSSNLFLCWCTHDSRTGGLHIHSYKHDLWHYACGFCPRILKILCSLTQPVTGILSNLVVVG